MTFAATFREVVVPQLRPLCERQAVAVAWGSKTFTEGYTAVMRHALTRGADLLPKNLQDELDSWICNTIMTEVNKNMPTVEQQRLAEETVGDQIDRWNILLHRRLRMEAEAHDLATVDV